MIKDLFEKLLVYVGLKQPAEVVEYNIPTDSLPYSYYEMLHGDVNFTLEERVEISKAIQEWNVFLDGYIVLNITFDYAMADAKLAINRTAIHRAFDQHPTIKTYQEGHNVSILGLCTFVPQQGPNMYLCYDKLGTNSLLWRLVAIHEIGHYLGLDHVDGEAVMRRACLSHPTTMTRLDAVEFARIYKIDPDQLVYRL